MPLRFAWALCALLVVASGFATEAVVLNHAVPAAAVAQKKYKVFVLTQSMGYRHAAVTRMNGQLSSAEKALTEIGVKSGLYEAECSQDASVLTAEKLKTLDALIFFTTGNLPLKPLEFTAVQDWIRSGKAFLGIHSAVDTFKEFKPYTDMLGATYLRHPWNAGGVVRNLEAAHPAVKMFPAEFMWRDEICDYQNFDARKARVLLSLNMEKSVPQVAHMVPICWVREYGKGRIFYTNFGNSPEVWDEALFRQHLLGGLRWTLMLDAGEASPNPETQLAEDQKARLAVLEPEKAWLAKAAQSASADPAVIWAAAQKMAREDKSAFAKLQSAVVTARSDEKVRSATLKRNQKPSEADLNAVRLKRSEIISLLLPKKEQ